MNKITVSNSGFNLILYEYFSCECPKPDVPCIRGILCPRVGDLRAIYENKTKTLRLYSQTIADLLRHDSAYDKLYLEFGELIQKPNNIARAHAVPTAPRNSYAFSKSPGKEHSMLSIEVSLTILISPTVWLKQTSTYF